MLTDHELSAMVAEKVMEWTQRENFGLCGGTCWRPPGSRSVQFHPDDFATDQGLALDAALKVGTVIDIEKWPNGWRAVVSTPAYGTTLARALCFAALRAVGVDVADDGEEGA